MQAKGYEPLVVLSNIHLIDPLMTSSQKHLTQALQPSQKNKLGSQLKDSSTYYLIYWMNKEATQLPTAKLQKITLDIFKYYQFDGISSHTTWRSNQNWRRLKCQEFSIKNFMHYNLASYRINTDKVIHTSFRENQQGYAL